MRQGIFCVIEHSPVFQERIGFTVHYVVAYNHRNLWGKTEHRINRGKNNELAIWYPSNLMADRFAVLLARIAYDALGGKVPNSFTIAMHLSTIGARVLRVSKVYSLNLEMWEVR